MTRRPRVLVVDDERNIRMTLRAAIEGLAALPGLVADVDEAANGADALARCATTRYDAVVLDLRMPGLGGLEVLARLRSLHPDVRVAVVTAHGTVDAAVEAMKLGAFDFLQKPFDPPQVRDLVARMIGGDLPAAAGPDVASLLAAARDAARAGRLDAAAQFARRAAASAPENPAAFHVLAVVQDLGGDRLRAQVLYRAALALDPTYRASESNLDRAMGGHAGPLLFGDEPR